MAIHTRAYEDVVIISVLSAYCGDLNLYALLAKRVRKGQEPKMTWKLPESDSKYTLSNYDTVITKIYTSTWDVPIYSALPFTNAVTYYQVHIDRSSHDFGGLFLGVSHGNNIGNSDFLNPDACVALYNDLNSLSSRSIRRCDDCTAQTGDVLGVVVDKYKDEIRFYKNGILVAYGTVKPSTMKSIHAVVWMYYKDMQLTLCDRYPYYSLKDNVQN
jgi:hypothetical protein